jgi:hypothetical protein
VNDTALARCWRAAHDLQLFRLAEAAEWAGVDEGRCANYLEAFVELGLLDRIGDPGHSALPHDQAVMGRAAVQQNPAPAPPSPPRKRRGCDRDRP